MPLINAALSRDPDSPGGTLPQSLLTLPPTRTTGTGATWSILAPRAFRGGSAQGQKEQEAMGCTSPAGPTWLVWLSSHVCSEGRKFHMIVAPRSAFLFARGVAVACQEHRGLELGPTLWTGPVTVTLRQDDEERKPPVAVEGQALPEAPGVVLGL